MARIATRALAATPRALNIFTRVTRLRNITACGAPRLLSCSDNVTSRVRLLHRNVDVDATRNSALRAAASTRHHLITQQHNAARNDKTSRSNRHCNQLESGGNRRNVASIIMAQAA